MSENPEVVAKMPEFADEAAINDVLAAETARLQAIGSQDWVALDLLLADELSYVHSDDGHYEDKAANLATLQASPRSYKRRDLSVRLYDDSAIMTGEIDITVAALPDGTLERHVFSFATQVWVHRDGRWQMAAFQATMLAAKN